MIGPEDVLDVAVWNNTEMTRTVPVRPDGKISLPLLNDVQAAGLTPTELRDHLTDALTEYISAATVSVIVREIHSVKVTVIATGIKADKMGMKPRSVISPAIRTAQQSVKNMMLKKERLPLEIAAEKVPAPTELPSDDLDVPTFLRRANRPETK